MIDYRLQHAIEEIKDRYGHNVVIKPKSLSKFGKNGNIGTTQELVWNQGGIEVMVTSGNPIDTVSSSNVNDEQEITIEGHVLEGSDLTFVVQRIFLEGQSQVTLDTPLYRSTRVYNSTDTGDGNGSGDFDGTVYIYQSGGTVTNGVPQDPDLIHLITDGSNNQSDKCATSISSSDYWILTDWQSSCRRSGSQARIVEFILQTRTFDGVWRINDRAVATNSGGTVVIIFDPCIIVRPNSDMRVLAVSSGGSTEADSRVNGYLAKVI